MDVNEEIIRAWLQICKNQFTMDNISFKVYGPKGGSNYSNIDLLAVDSSGTYYDYEVKWRSVYSISSTDRETPRELTKQLINKEREEKIRSIIGRTACKKLFITTYAFFGKSPDKRARIERLFQKKKISVLYFEDIIPELMGKINTHGRYDSPILQTIRMLKYFDLIKEKSD
jgi:hypothetical protein